MAIIKTESGQPAANLKEVTMTLELSLAVTKMSRLVCDLPYISKEIAVGQIAKFLVSQGFGELYSKSVAEQSWDLV